MYCVTARFPLLFFVVGRPVESVTKQPRQRGGYSDDPKSVRLGAAETRPFFLALETRPQHLFLVR